MQGSWFRLCWFGIFLIVAASCLAQPRVKVGADILMSKELNLVKGKKVGLITNHTGRLSSGQHLVDTLLAQGISVVALFGPEHGVRGEAAAGEKVGDTIDAKTGIPVFSLYGKTRTPTSDMLRDVDVLVYDIQDVGARFYTYISTMGLCMKAAIESGIPFIVLDRPNPLGGLKVEGPILEDSLKSFVGMYPIPLVYGLTCGELAMMINGEGWLATSAKADLTVVRMEGWTRSMLWDDTGLSWIRPSPNIPTPVTALVYPGTCLIEATNLSEGRGTDAPFLTIGAPFVEAGKLVNAMQALNLLGVEFSVTGFTPSSSEYSGQYCYGIRIQVTDVRAFHPVFTGLALFQQCSVLLQDSLKVREISFARLLGNGQALKRLRQKDAPEMLMGEWRSDLERFKQLSTRYWLYRDN